MLNVDTFKSLCMLAKTAQGKEIRKYYMKLENVNNKITKEEIENTKKLLDNKQYQLEQTQLELENEKTLSGSISSTPCLMEPSKRVIEAGDSLVLSV